MYWTLIARKRFLPVLSLLVGLILVGAGCVGATPTANETGAEPEAWPGALTIGAASLGGIYHLYAGGWAEVIEKSTGVAAAVEVTGGPNDNMRLGHSGDLQLGMVTMGPAWEGWHGEADWTGGLEMTNVRAIFPMYTTYSQWWAFRDSGIASIADLDGKTVGVGPVGGTPGTYHPLILELLGVDASVHHAGLNDLVSQHLAGQLDANSFAAGIPVPGVLETAASGRELLLFGVDGEAQDKVVQQWPFWATAVIPREAYDFLDHDVETVAMWNMAVAHKDLPASLVYEIVKGVFENHDMMLAAHPSSEETLAENVLENTWMLMHPGAIQYYEEIGIQLPADIYPPDDGR